MKVQMRALKGEDGKRFIEGYASLFNVQSRMLFEGGKTFREVIRTGAFDSVLGSDELNVIANIDHDMSRMLGRTVSGTLGLSVDSNGLKYRIEVPNTQLGNDTYEQVERGDLYESSFAFGTLERDVEWGRDRRDGMLLRFVNNVSLLRDISIVRNGAYGDTDVAAREYQDMLTLNLSVGECEGELCQRVASDVMEIKNPNIDETKRDVEPKPDAKSENETTKVETVKDTTEVKPDTVQTGSESEKKDVKVETVVPETTGKTEDKVETPTPDTVAETKKVVEDQNDTEDYKEFVKNKYNEINELV